MRLLTLTMVTALLAILVGAAAAQEAPVEKIDKLITQRYEADEFSGNVLIAKAGEVVYEKSFGLANKDHNVANSGDTKFNIGSIGKLFTSIAIFQLIQAGQLDLNDPIGKHLTDFPNDKKDITIRQLLLHTSGLGNYMTHPDYPSGKAGYRSVGDLLPLVKSETLQFVPGVGNSYSNSGFIVLGAIIEQITGQDYAGYVRENIWLPAGMNETRLCFRENVLSNRASGYIRKDDRMISNVFEEPPACSDGGTYSTVGDLLKFDLALQKGVLLDDEHLKLWLSPQVGPMSYGPATAPPERSFSGKGAWAAAGGAPGVSAAMHHVYGDDYTIVVLANYGDVAMRAAMDIEATLYGVMPPPGPPGR